MDIDIVAAEMLLTASGVAILVAVIIKYLFKKPLSVKFRVAPEFGEADPYQKANYSLVINVSALVLGLVFSFAGQFVFNTVSSEIVLLAIVNGIFGAFGATGLSEVGSNAASFIRKR